MPHARVNFDERRLSVYRLDGGSSTAEMQCTTAIKYLANVGLSETSQLVYEQS